MIRNTQNNEKKNHGNQEDPGLAAEDSAVVGEPGENQEAKSGLKENARAAEGSSPAEETNLDEEDVSVAELKKKLKENIEEIARKNEEVEALKDILKRRQADFENYKKRMVRSQEEYRKQAIKDMSMDVISINDDLLRAIEASNSVIREGGCSESHRSFVEGVTIISRSIEDMLKRFGVTEIESLNREFDPNHNEAVEIDESDQVMGDTITKVYQKGFILDDLVIRPAKVKVTRPARKLQEDGPCEDNCSAPETNGSSEIEGGSGDIGLN